jgi:hypothetical protein
LPFTYEYCDSAQSANEEFRSWSIHGKQDIFGKETSGRVYEVGRACSTNGEKRNVYRLLVGKPEGKQPLGRPRRRCIYNIKMALLEICLSSVDWIGLAEDRYRWRALVNAVIGLRVP